MKENREFEYGGSTVSGFGMLGLLIVIVAAIILAFVSVPEELEWIPGVCAAVGVIGIALISGGFFVLQPNQAVVMIFFGKYRGTFRKTGFYWVNPFMKKLKISLRIRNMDVAPIKVNDKVGNPVMIGMVLVWKVKDTYRAVFDVDGTVNALNAFVEIQSDAALREVTGKYAYDEENGKHDEITLRSDGDEINEQLETKLNERLAMAGIEVVEARLNYLAYAPEIAAVMLRRQQASAIISAREKIVEGAVSMVKMALDQLSQEQIVELDEERKATMVSNLLVVLCADEPAQPVLNTGTLYQ